MHARSRVLVCVAALAEWVFSETLNKSEEVLWLLGTGGQLSAVLFLFFLPYIRLRTIWRIKWESDRMGRTQYVCGTREHPQSNKRCGWFQRCMRLWLNWFIKQPKLLSSQNVNGTWVITCLRAISDYCLHPWGPLVGSQSRLAKRAWGTNPSSSLPNMVKVPGKDSLSLWRQAEWCVCAVS